VRADIGCILRQFWRAADVSPLARAYPALFGNVCHWLCQCIPDSQATGHSALAKPVAHARLNAQPIFSSGFFPHGVVGADRFEVLQHRGEEFVAADRRAVADDDELSPGTSQRNIHPPCIGEESDFAVRV
jgi:hypothetical protein